MKSIHKGEVKENIHENQRGIFLVNAVSKICENVLKRQNKNGNENMSPMQIVEGKQRSTVHNLIILDPLIENQEENQNKIHFFLQMSRSVLINCG